MPTSSKDLWATALKTLTETDRQQLVFDDGSDRLNVLSDLQVLTERAKEQCIKKKWRLPVPGRNGETIVLRDIFTKMVVWIDTFKQIGDVIVQYDPGHAALPWAGVRFIIQIAVRDIIKFGFVVEGAESIARMIGRYAIFEKIYLRSTSAASMELENALVQLYSTMLMYQSNAKRFFEQNSAKRVIRSVTEGEFPSLVRKMDLQQSVVDRCAATLNAENQSIISDSIGALAISQDENDARLKGLLQKMDEPILRMSSQLNDIEDNMDESKRYEILRWLSAQPYPDHHEQISKKALPGTGRWLLEDSTYAEWHKGSSSSLLWLHGKVGAGKSTLVSIVIEDAMKRSEAGKSPPPVYFYCSRNAAEPQRSEAAAIFSSIVGQLSCAEPGLPLLPPVVDIYEKKGQRFSSQGIRIEDSCEIIKKLTEYYPMTTIVVDALDECNAEERGMILDAIEGLLQNSSLGLLKVFLSSRDDQDITCTLREYPNLDLVSSRNSADIEAFVREETHRLVKKQRLLRHSNAKEEMKKLIVDKVSRGADGMFRWASLQLEMLCSMKVDQDVREWLGRIPPKLEQLYEEIYENNLLKYPGEEGQSIISNVMKWLLCAQRPMKCAEFCTVVAFKSVSAEELTKELVLDLCHNFVVFDDSLHVFRFAHLSVREFLEKKAEFMANSCHILAAETCLLQFIGLSDWPAARDFLKDHYTLELRGKAASTAEMLGGFHAYATMFWAKHCQLIGEDGRTRDPLFERIFRFFLSDGSDDLSPLNIWIESEWRSKSFWSLKERLARYQGCRPEDRAFVVACAYEFGEIIRLCMNERSTEVVLQGCEFAVEFGAGEALKLLLSNCNEDEISIYLVSLVAGWMDPDILDWVLRKSQFQIIELLDYLIVSKTNKQIVERLMARYEPGKVSQSLVKYAARYCSASTNELVLRQNQESENSWVWDLLIEEAEQAGNGEVISALLGKRRFQVTPGMMQAIAESGDENTIQLLLDPDNTGEIPSEVINASLLNPNEKVLNLLLDLAGSGQVSKVDITKAICNPNEKILGLLLDRGYPMSQTLVDQAARYGYISTLRLLLDRGGLITGLVLRCATRNPKDPTKMMSLLLAEADDCIIMEQMMEMMKITVGQGNGGQLKLLLERVGDILITEDVLATAAIDDSDGEMIKSFSERDWEMTEEVLEIMMKRSDSEEVLQLVLDRLKDLDITKKVLLAAASNSSFGDRLVRRLLDRISLPDVMGPLLVEAAGNQKVGLEIILLLRRRFGDIDVTEEAIGRAAHTGSIRTMTFLLDHTSAPISEAIVLRVLTSRSLGMLQLVLNRATDLPITREMTYRAALHDDIECLVLLWKRASKAEITEDIRRDSAQVAMENIWPSVGKYKFLIDEVKGLVFTPKILINIVEKDDPELYLDFFIDHGINMQITREMLQAAATRNNASMMTFLLERSNNIELTDDVFKAAAGNGDEEVLQVLSEYNGLAEVPKKWLDIARLRGAVSSRTDEIKELITRGVEPDVPDKYGLTPLFRAIATGHIPTVQALLSAGANPNSVDSDGRTPLYSAAWYGHYAIVEILLDLGVPTHLKDKGGQTPASDAKRQGHMRVFRLLERRRQP